MAHSQILLLQPIEGLGGEGELVKVRAGFARNYLLPRRLALPVTQANRKHVEALRARRTEREAKELEGARALAETLKAVTLAFAVKTGEGGKMFGSVTQGDVHAKLEELGHKIEKKRVHVAGGHVKSLGKHEASIRLHPEVTVEITFEVVSENPIAETKPAEGAAGDKERKPRKPRPERVEAAVETAPPAADEGEASAEEAPTPKAKKRVRREHGSRGDDADAPEAKQE